MCTVSFLPQNNGQFILTSNRDERTARKTISPLAYPIGNNTVFYPKDIEAGGTWIAAADSGRVSCLLNGAFEKHKRKQSYSKSRGTVLLEAFEYENVSDFYEEVDLANVEPFTLIVFDAVERPKLYEFRWDGHKKYLQSKNLSIPHIWSSATLYSSQVRAKREEWFTQWLKQQKSFERVEVMAFHSSNQGIDSENDIIMERQNGLRTVSITQIEYDKEGFSMHYNDLLLNRKSSLSKGLKKVQYV